MIPVKILCVKLSPGRAYVRGFGVDITGNKVLDVEKPRDTKKLLIISRPI